MNVEWKKLAEVITGTDGSDSLNRLAKLIVIGELKRRGFVDGRNDSLKEVFKEPFVYAGTFNLLVRSSLLRDRTYVWDFAGGISEGAKLGQGDIPEYNSSTGRRSKWVGGNAVSNWDKFLIAGVVLVG